MFLEQPSLEDEKKGHLQLGLQIGLAFLIGFAFFFWAERFPNISDTIGYVYAGERLASGAGPTFDDPNNAEIAPYFSLFAFQIRRTDDSRMFLGFPPGFPILLAIGIILGGDADAVHYVVPFMAVIGLWTAYALGKALSRHSWTGLWAALLLAMTPAYWEFGTSAWSEVPSMTIVTAGIWLYLISRQESRPRSHVILLSVAGSLLLSFSFFIRYANVVFLPALGLYELVNGRGKLLSEKKRWPFFGITGLALLGIPLFNHFYYGGVQLTSYSPIHGWYPQPAFSMSYALGPSFVNGHSLVEVGKTLWRNFPFLLLMVPAGWFLFNRASILLLVASTLGTVGLYSFYAFAPSDVNSRFLLPIFPFISISIAHAICSISYRLPNGRWRWLVGACCVILLITQAPGYARQLAIRNRGDLDMVAHVRYMTKDTEPEAVFLSYRFNDQISFYGDRSVLNYRRIPPSDPAAGRYHWELLEPCLVNVLDGLLARTIPVYYVKGEIPPFANSFAILQKYYQLDLIREGPEVYLLNPSPQLDLRGDLIACELPGD